MAEAPAVAGSSGSPGVATFLRSTPSILHHVRYCAGVSSTQASSDGPLRLFIGLSLVAAAMFVVLWAIDHGTGIETPWLAVRAIGKGASLQGVSEVTVGVLGVVITVVSIIVELAATRYTARITEIFLTDRTNQIVMASYMLTAAVVMWVELTLQGGRPQEVSAMVLAATFMLSTSILSLMPYFAYVLRFLSPREVVRRLASRGESAIDRLASTGSVERAWADVLTPIDQLSDIAHKSVQNQDKGIAVEATRWLTELLLHHLEAKPKLPDGWFDVYDKARRDFDFVAFHRDVVRDLMPTRTWVDMKVLLQLRALYLEALRVGMADTAHFVAIQTRRFGVRAAEREDRAAAELALRFLNSYMRAAINRSDVHSAYNLLNEYRLLGVGLLHAGHHNEMLDVARRMKDYGQVSFARRLPFILETVAYDLCTLLERVHGSGSPAHDELLAIFLDVDREPEGHEAQESALRGVRKAQVKLATWYVVRGEHAAARLIASDMSDEPASRLQSIREELEATVSPIWWEISDRGTNFDYLEPERRRCLDAFFEVVASERQPSEGERSGS